MQCSSAVVQESHERDAAHAMQSGSCSLAVSSMAYAGVATPPLPLDAGPAVVPAALRHAGQYANNVHLVISIDMNMLFALTLS